jgi:hypothetical protein
MVPLDILSGVCSIPKYAFPKSLICQVNSPPKTVYFAVFEKDGLFRFLSPQSNKISPFLFDSGLAI